MNVFISTLFHETNTFSPIPCDRESYEEHLWIEGDAIFSSAHDLAAPSVIWRDRVEQAGGSIAAGMSLAAMPCGPTPRPLYEEICNAILERLRRSGPVDLVLLFLHGAMVAEGVEDCEGDLLKRIRAELGSGPVVGVLLDLHCHITKEMLDRADALVTCKEYPHTDFAESAQRLFDLCMRFRCGAVQLTRTLYECGLVNRWGTTAQPMRAFVDRLRECERTGAALSISFAHGFSWADVDEGGARLLIISEDDAGLALAEKIGEELWQIREQAAQHYVSVDEALDRALLLPTGPAVLADVADNPGGGAPCDSTFILQRMLDRGISNAAVCAIWDPIAVRFAKGAGEGATLALRIGGKCGPASGAPIDVRATVRAIRRDFTQTGFGGNRVPMGDAVWVTAEGIDIVINSVRTQTLHPDAMTGLGLPFDERKILVVKSTQHFVAGFGPHASAVYYVSTPGALEPDFAAIPYRKFTRPFWPRQAEPFATVPRLVYSAKSPRRASSAGMRPR
jgi:microcystin degradation protein MlrC